MENYSIEDQKKNKEFFIGGTMNEWVEYWSKMPSAQDRDGTFHFGKWTVSKSGYMVWDKWYDIDEKRLAESDWFYHLFSKGWIDWNEFIPAYFQACKNAKIQTVNVRIFYKNE